MKFITLFITLVSLSYLSPVFAQESSGSLDSGTIESQIDYLYGISNNYQEYKVIRRSSFEQLKGNILDSLRVGREEVAKLNSQIFAQQDTITSLEGQLQSAEEAKQEAISEKDNFSFLGIGIHKSVYSSMMWVIVAVLGLALGFFSLQYSRSFKKIRKAQRDLEEVQEEFDQHRKNTLERERKMKRELIDVQMGKK
ncbi:hypothetical protein [Algoriphagus sediminis]|uniref:tRNA (Guanine-N1)-methyltransferase n=1 Tax=Algoriphagus sediminis TaxID=3057113 RepID=A0ABT7YBF8_9BACT|nr:hypothetical protein [Algoriphagus sediminis]MDN3203833.1 hypothetical protein [Algoriphagus sediminis]